MTLRVQDLTVSYGKIQVLHPLSFNANGGELVVIVGPNGAGKSSLLSAIMGGRDVTGEILLDTQDKVIPLQKCSVKDRARQGVRLVQDSNDVFQALTVAENLKLGAYLRRDHRAIRAEQEELLTRFPRLRERLKTPAGLLSGGEMRLLLIVRALLGQPKVLLLDEPSSGLSPLMLTEVLKLVQERVRGGMIALLAEQNIAQTLPFADQLLVLDNGRLSRHSDGTTPLNSEELVYAYFGDRQ